MAWHEFRRGKRQRKDLALFERDMEKNIFSLRHDLLQSTYRHGKYEDFYVCDPKQRHIHKAAVRDRFLHQAVYGILYPIFAKSFIYHSFSCQIGKGTHKAVAALTRMIRSFSRDYTRPCYALKCDVRKFFDSLSHDVLLCELAKKVKDEKILSILEEIIGSYWTKEDLFRRKSGVPIGNLTSQLFANVYLHSLDCFVKHELKEKYYMRYTDDFVLLGESPEYLKLQLQKIEQFFSERLCLTLHPHKVTIRKVRQGVDFLGYIILPRHRVLRTKTKRRILKKLKQSWYAHQESQLSQESFQQILQSYLGVLSHANSYELSCDLQHAYFFLTSAIFEN